MLHPLRFCLRPIIWPAAFLFLGSLLSPSHVVAGGAPPAAPEPLAEVPPLEEGTPAAGRRVKVFEPEYAGTGVYHSLYLPANYNPQRGSKYPLIVEYTGNFFPASGSTGEVSGAHFGFAATLGKDFIWVVLPYVSTDGKRNETRWWGDEKSTVAYAKKCIPQILEQFHGDPRRVVLCGFSRGAIAVSYLGLYDDEIAGLWTAFMTHDHFDGIREWKGTAWGSPLEAYRDEAAVRLRRLKGRPFWVGQNGGTKDVQEFLESRNLQACGDFHFEAIPIAQIFPVIPNARIPHPHTDLWALFPSPSADHLRAWLGGLGNR